MSPADEDLVLEPFGDAAILITLAEQPSIATAARAQAIAGRIRGADVTRSRWLGVVPGAASVVVHIHAGNLAVDEARAALIELARLRAGDDAWPESAPRVDIPVRYGGDGGPDLETVADATGLTEKQVVEAHASAAYRVLFLGFAPGFAYLGALPPELVIPRRASPRVRVPAGSVAIAGPYAAVYPIESPGGWHLLGATTARLWDPALGPDRLLAPGTLVRFVPEPP